MCDRIRNDVVLYRFKGGMSILFIINRRIPFGLVILHRNILVKGNFKGKFQFGGRGGKRLKQVLIYC